MKVIILAGGRATRLPHSARDIPKALVSVGSRTILGHLLEGLRSHGLFDIRLALGFRAEQVIRFLKEQGYQCEYVIEPKPLGTGGAIKFAAGDFSGPFMVLNGDTLADFDYPAIVRSHEADNGLIVSHWKEDNRDYGVLKIDGDWIREFLEKPSEPRSGFIHAGCSILEPKDVRAIPEDAFMLERDVYPMLAREGRLKTFRHEGFFEDIGTEERLARLRETFPEIQLRV